MSTAPTTAGDFDPIGFVQRQLDAYNAHDLDRFVREYTDDIAVHRLPGATPFIEGKAAFSAFYRENRFSLRGLRAEVLNRMSFGHTVIDHERIVGLEAEPFEAAVVYEVTPAGISKVWFVDGA